jgi:hypothetical protein
VSKKAADHHTKASEHHAEAAKHHSEAAKTTEPAITRRLRTTHIPRADMLPMPVRTPRRPERPTPRSTARSKRGTARSKTSLLLPGAQTQTGRPKGGLSPSAPQPLSSLAHHPIAEEAIR